MSKYLILLRGPVTLVGRHYIQGDIIPGREMSRRPGTECSRALYKAALDERTMDEWERSSDWQEYKVVVTAVDKSKKKNGRLIELDRFRNEDLVAAAERRGHLTLKEVQLTGAGGLRGRASLARALSPACAEWGIITVTSE
jgi:hypothetical protein